MNGSGKKGVSASSNNLGYNTTPFNAGASSGATTPVVKSKNTYVKFLESFVKKLPWQQERVSQREKLWNFLDSNGTGYLSYRKVEEGFIRFMTPEQLLSVKHVLLRAFTVAKNLRKTMKD